MNDPIIRSVIDEFSVTEISFSTDAELEIHVEAKKDELHRRGFKVPREERVGDVVNLFAEF